MIYQRLTIRTCARYAAIISPIVTLVSGLVFFSRLLGDAAAGSIPAFILGQMFVLTLIKYAPQLLILSVFAGTFIALRRAFTQNEMDAWFSSGLGLHDFIKPVLLFALPAALFVALFSLYASPWAVYKMNVVRTAAAFDIDIESLPAQQFGNVPGKTHSYFLDKNNLLFIASNKQNEVIFARGLRRESETTLRLIDGNLFYLSAPDNINTLEKMRFGSMRLSLPAAEETRQRPRAKRLAALNWQNSRERAEFVWRLTLPLAVLALALTALFLSPAHSRLGRRFGFLSAIAIFFLYLNGLRFVRDQVAHEVLSAPAALLLPPLVLGLLVLALARAQRR